jgi:hypothetical protein
MQMKMLMSNFVVGISRVYEFEQLSLVAPAASKQGDNLLATPATAGQTHILTEADIQAGAAADLLNTLNIGVHSIDLVVPFESARALVSGQGAHPTTALPASSTQAAAVSGSAAAEIKAQPHHRQAVPSTSSVSAAAQGPALALNASLGTPMSHLAAWLSQMEGVHQQRGSRHTRPHSSAASTPPVLPGEGSFLFDDNEGGDTATPAAAAASGAASLALPQHTSGAFRLAEAGDAPGLIAHMQALSPAEALGAAQCAHPRHGGTLLHVLAASAAALEAADFTPAAQCVLDAGSNVNALAANGSTALHWAAGSGNVAAVSALLSAGADACAVTYVWRRQVFGKGSGQTPLHWAAESGHTAVIQELLQAQGGAQRGTKGGVSGWQGGSADLVRTFSASPHIAAALIPDERGVTAGELAEKSGYKAAQEAIGAVVEQPMVRLRVRLAGQRVAGASTGQPR